MRVGWLSHAGASADFSFAAVLGFSFMARDRCRAGHGLTADAVSGRSPLPTIADHGVGGGQLPVPPARRRSEPRAPPPGAAGLARAGRGSSRRAWMPRRHPSGHRTGENRSRLVSKPNILSWPLSCTSSADGMRRADRRVAVLPDVVLSGARDDRRAPRLWVICLDF